MHLEEFQIQNHVTAGVTFLLPILCFEYWFHCEGNVLDMHI